MRTIKFYFDLVSTYSYVGYELLRLQARAWAAAGHQVRIELLPFQIGYIFKQAKNAPPMAIPNKAVYMGKDITRTSNMIGMPWDGLPDFFPFNTKPALVALALIGNKYGFELDNGNSVIAKATLALMRSAWSGDAQFVPDTPENVTKVLVDAKIAFPDGASAADIVAEALKNPQYIEIVRENSKVAFEKHRAFGAPTIVVCRGEGEKEHMIWGSDRFEVVADILDLPYTPVKSIVNKIGPVSKL
ncbi:thioredoxin-like protein [Ramicandelaber brevisporus]|nr:thioredoxin-like protein [Ramicandelaber brevisporus]